MASTKDMRRPDLYIPYVERDQKSESDAGTMIASTLPMVAMFMRNKLIGWTAVLFAVQAWLAETPSKRKESTQPAILTVAMSIMSVGIAYLPLFLPPQATMRTGTGTEAPAAAPPS